MDESLDRLKPNRQIREEAAEWLVLFNADTPDAASRAQFDEWLRASPEHIRAYLELLPLWSDSASLAQVNRLTPQELIDLASRLGTNVKSLSLTDIGLDTGAQPAARAAQFSMETRRSDADKGPTRRIAKRFAIAAGLAIFGSAALTVYQLRFPGDRYFRTEVAEVRTLTLEDGTQLFIGAKSAVRVRYTEAARTFNLEGGDIYVDVAKDARRPFVVEVKDKLIRALGTQFEVRTDDQATRVAVIEGSVLVSGAAPHPMLFADENRAPQSVVLKAGQQLTATRSARLEAPQPIRSREPAAWRTGRLVFDGATLGDVVREFNRYNTKRLKLLNPALEKIPIEAAFSSADLASLMRFLKDQPEISVSERSGEVLIDAR